ncbi:4-alpha-glucanotransferase [Thiohalophilus thiocyanatoxydans]|uniref:4-alpha-glucanotransferase n=1 Tax=Thiohalophilus thiocyanatoxydans TaxID=381308 RepID=A0A4R8INP3_9GAMM|nr:4-alpha-glucanotransferase [Thiohalophilus thiocyanatoxydans]TDY02511.1 4-alpha-glucanotransferase [Thiohalophilus thiocyanatoxydans]
MHPLYRQRRGGVLLHPTSLPGPLPRGQICHDAYRFIDFLQQTGVTIWQMLPLGPTHTDGSPYLALSAHAGNPELISLDWLKDRKLLDNPAQVTDFVQHRQQLEQAWEQFNKRKPRALFAAYEAFVARQSHWLDDYSLFMSIRESQQHRSWTEWPAPLRDRQTAALQQSRTELAERIDFQCFCQFVVSQQWHDLKQYANAHDVKLLGDIPIYVSLDSADIWAQRGLFTLDAEGHPQQIAGVPPDYFSKTGQLWGNPLYRWDIMRQDNFLWWRQRMQTQLALFDVVRIDHFRGLRAFWAVPANAETAMEGHWVEAPGDELLEALHENFPELPLVAEDLGMITEDVHALRKKFGLPGMKILQFAFDGAPNNHYLPHQHEFESLVYTGTHDNDTTLSWYRQLDEKSRRYVREYLGLNADTTMPWPLIRSALASVSCLAVIPMQDFLELGSENRMNTPGTLEGNWQWRFDWEQLPADLTAKLHHLLHLYGRL